jgi:hypothetical protein
MKNKDIKQQIINEYAAEKKYPGGGVWERLENSVSARKAKTQRMPVKRLMLIAAAVMLSCTMVVSAVTIAYNIYTGMYMLPGMGLFDEFNENVRTMPEVLEFGDTTIEMAMTYGQDGVNTFYMAIYGEGGRHTGSRPDRRDYQDLEIIFSDGASVSLTGRIRSSGSRSNMGGDHLSNNFFMYEFEYKNFPDEYEFTLKNDGGASAAIALAPIEPRRMKITDNGIKRIKAMPAAKGSRIFSYNIEVIKPSAVEKAAGTVMYWIHSRGDIFNPVNEIIYKDGTVLSWHVGGRGHATPIFAADENADYKYRVWGESCFAYDFVQGEVDKIIIRELWANLGFYENTGLITVNIPVPENGEKIDYDIPFEVGAIGEFTVLIDAVKRERNNLLVYTSEKSVKYSGNEEISKVTVSFDNIGGRGGTDEEGNHYNVQTIKIPEDHSGNTLETAIRDIIYTIHGYWEIEFE